MCALKYILTLKIPQVSRICDCYIRNGVVPFILSQPFNSPSLSSFNKSLLYICSLTCLMAPLVNIHVEPPHAKILAIGTANPPNVYYQKDYPDFLFRVTKNEHKTHLREKFDCICKYNFYKNYSCTFILHMNEITLHLYSKTRKRYLYLTEEILNANPSIYTYGAPSLDVRQDMLNLEGQPISKITHLIFCTASYVDMPSADFQLVKTMIYEAGCYAGATVLRLAKDFAENKKGARVLVVCAEITTVFFHGLTDTHLDILVEEQLGLKEGKLRATRHVLSEYGNMGAPSVHFILDEMRNKSIGEGKATTGEGLE
ncbi:unnamed protein product [Malus baccata var. baccata]